MVPTRRKRPNTRRFYEKALSAAEQADLAKALEIEGFEQEIAALRLRLRTALKDEPEDFALILRGMDVLRRMVATKYQLSKDDEEALQSAFVEETLRRVEERGEGGGEVDAA
jgi:inactivated superfamily I helicase